MKKKFSSKRGEMYIEAVVTTLVLTALLIACLSTFRVATVKTQADAVADQLLETATFYGCFGEEFDAMLDSLRETFPGLTFEVSYDGDWYNATLERVQLGDTMTVTVTYYVSFGGFGSYLTMALDTTRTGSSENYWKTV